MPKAVKFWKKVACPLCGNPQTRISRKGIILFHNAPNCYFACFTVGRKLSSMKTAKISPPANKDGYSDKEIQDILTPEEYPKFRQWITGQTCTDDGNGELLTFTWDLLRFIDWIRKGTPTYFD